MKKKSGLFIILVSMLITVVFWLFIKPTRDIPLISQYSQLLASFALVGFCIINFISTRHRVLDKLFNGLDRSYIYHKVLSISVLIMIVVHNVSIGMGKDIIRQSGNRVPRDPYAMYGSFSLYLFVILIAVAILAKKLNYERWKNIHKFMLIPYALGIYHYYGSANYAVFSMDAFSVWLDIVNVIGILSAIYSIFIYEKTGFKYRFKVNKLDTVANGTLEITGSSLGRSMKFKPGQFAFLKIKDKRNNFPSHPFTISQAPKEGEIQFTLKALGDHTKELFDTLKVGDEFYVEGPHGEFNFKTGVKNQIWIAGGIGVTPFRSFMQSGVPKDYSVDFFYAYNNEQEGAYVEELQSLAANSNFKLHLFNSKEKGFLSAEEISKHIYKKDNIDVYFCGPKPMRESLRKQFQNSKLKINQFHFENFQFK
ncbi:ferredoxin reductase family protein [Inconstantimicrobium mannanitabidum]|uniref:Membrane protein n=1 Tax=Inconstantimicrobium mannanitabidum TaxID=1604901 RepID=A0ACB5RDQ2_9CLOT|nr:ferric reductase-like transmembrane domain-containing protein [Clostridium sp. TW13]GKX67403.1 membrane protein [Clostridium sp. TW13]